MLLTTFCNRSMFQSLMLSYRIIAYTNIDVSSVLILHAWLSSLIDSYNLPSSTMKIDQHCETYCIVYRSLSMQAVQYGLPAIQ